MKTYPLHSGRLDPPFAPEAPNQPDPENPVFVFWPENMHASFHGEHRGHALLNPEP